MTVPVSAAKLIARSVRLDTLQNTTGDPWATDSHVSTCRQSVLDSLQKMERVVNSC